MSELMKAVAKCNDGLTEEEQTLLAFAYKNITETRRKAWRTITDLEQNTTENLDEIRNYRELIERELQNICYDVLVSGSYL